MGSGEGQYELSYDSRQFKKAGDGGDTPNTQIDTVKTIQPRN